MKFIVALVLRNTSWENKLSLLLLGGFLAAVWALYDADRVQYGLAVASYGIVAMVAIWVIHELAGGRSRRRNRTPRGSAPVPPAAVIPK